MTFFIIYHSAAQINVELGEHYICQPASQPGRQTEAYMHCQSIDSEGLTSCDSLQWLPFWKYNTYVENQFKNSRQET